MNLLVKSMTAVGISVPLLVAGWGVASAQSGGGAGCAHYQAGSVAAGPNGAAAATTGTGVGGCAGGGGSGRDAGCAYYQAWQVSAGPEGAVGNLVTSGTGQCVGA
ncbi:hypothetical protein ACWEGE_05010 [Amycolatopsis sp. NPDC004747]